MMLYVKYFVIYLYILIILIKVSTCFIPKHKYKKLTIESDKLCSPVAIRKIELKRNKEEALIVSQTSTRDHSVDWTTNLQCEFQVQSDSGLFAVVQTLNFRRNETSGECIDYIQFDTYKTNPTKLCGNLNVFNTLDEEFEVSKRSSIVFSGRMSITIFISKERWKNEDRMNLKIVFTKFKRCDHNYVPCLMKKSDLCINRSFLNDTLVNCPFINCEDEVDCDFLRQRLSEIEVCGYEDCDLKYFEMNSTKVIISAVTSLIISFIVFVACIWVCRKTGKICWSANCTDSNQSNNRLQSRVIEMQNRASESTAPTVDTTQTQPSAPDPDKDLPPSYESLFPTR